MRAVKNSLDKPIANKSKFMASCENDKSAFPFDSDSVYGLGYAIINKKLHFISPKSGVSEGMTVGQLRKMIYEYKQAEAHDVCPTGCRMTEEKLYVQTIASKAIIVHRTKLRDWIAELEGTIYLIEDGLPGTRGQNVRAYE